MVTKRKASAGAKKGRVKVDKLKLNKETVKDLSASEQLGIRAGYKLGQRPGPGDPGNSIAISCECPMTATPDCYSQRDPC